MDQLRGSGRWQWHFARSERRFLPGTILHAVAVTALLSTFAGVGTIQTRKPGSGMPASASPTVADLVLEASRGEARAWDALVDRFAPTVWAVARAHRLSAADSADVSQTTWMHLVENLHRIEQPERVGAWLATTARRESLRIIRLRGRQVPHGDDIDLIPDPQSFDSPEHGVAVRDRAGLVNGLVEKLPLKSQLLVRLLAAHSPLSYRDISESLDMPIGSIGPTRARALDNLRRLAVQAGLDPQDVLA